MLAVMLPMMVPHYALAVVAMVVPKAALWPVLAVDAALVGVLTAVTTAGGLYAALRAADLAGVALRPGDDAAEGRPGGAVALGTP